MTAKKAAPTKLIPQLKLDLAPLPYPTLAPLLGHLKGKLVIMRTDYNVPPTEDAHSHHRVLASLPSLRLLMNEGARTVLLTHRGRPQGKVKPELSTRVIADALGQLLGKPVAWAPDCVGRVAEQAVEALAPGEILLLENTRFHMGEQLAQHAFINQLATLAGAAEAVFINDAFASAHRAHASISGLTGAFGQSVIGPRMEAELQALRHIQYEPRRPLLVMLGGASARP